MIQVEKSALHPAYPGSVFADKRPVTPVHLQFRTGAVIYSTTQQADYFYLLRAGKVSVYNYNPDGQELIVDVLSAPALLGEDAWDGRPLYQTCAEAVIRSSLDRFRARDRRKLATLDPQTDALLSGLYAQKMERLTRRIITVMYANAREKLAAVLLDYSDQTDQGTKIVTLNQTLLAGLTSNRREHINLLLKRFREEGLITRISQRAIAISNPQTLAQIAQRD